MATGDILSCTVLATGWEAEIVIEGLSDAGKYKMDASDAGTGFGNLTDRTTATVKFTVVSEGYNTSGTLGTKTRYVYGTRARMKAYDQHALAEEAEADGNLTVTIALSDYIYDDDNTGAGKSGTAPTVTIGAGFYTEAAGDGGTANNAATDVAVTNNSTQDYPKVIARWAVVPYQRFTDTFDLECVAFHRFAENGKPVACVKFQVYEGEDEITSDIVTAMVKSSAADSLPCYKQTIDASDYTDNAVVTCQFTAYPWVGDADSILTTVGGTANALTLGPLPLVADSDDDYGVTYAAVNTSTGADSGTKAFNTAAAAQAAPCATIRYALAQIAAYNNTNYSRNNADAGIIYLQSNNHSWGDGTGSATTTNVWVTVTRDPNVAKANAVIAGTPNGTVVTALTHVFDATLAPSGESGSTFVIQGAGTRTLWLDSVNADPSVAHSTTLLSWGHKLTYNTFCTADHVDKPWANYSTGNIAALIRGCSATNVSAMYTGDAYAPQAALTTTADHGNTYGTGTAVFNCPTVNSIVAYCQDLANPTTASQPFRAETAASDVALVCNVSERTAAGVQAMAVYDDGNTQPSTNVILWHNTTAGERANVGYNEGTANTARSNFSLRFNAFQWQCTKHDVFETDGTRTAAWSVTYGVGWMGNNSEKAADQFVPYYFGLGSTRTTEAGYTDDQSITTEGTGNGDYHPAAGSVLIGKIPTAADVVIPWDIEGTAYAAGGNAGAYTEAGGEEYTLNVAGTLTATGALVRSTGKPLAGTATMAGVLTRSIGRGLAGTLTAAGALSRSTGKGLAGSAVASGSLARSIGRGLAGTLTAAGSLTKQVGRSFAGTMVAAGTLTAIKTILLALAGVMTAAGSLSRSTGKAFAGTLAAAGSVTKQIGRAFSGTLEATGALSVLKTFLLSLSGVMTASGSLNKQASKGLSGTLVAAGNLTKRIARSLAGEMTAAGTVAALKTFLLSIAGTMTATGALARSVGKQVAGTAVAAGSLTKRVGRSFAGTMTAEGALATARAYMLALAGVMEATGSLTKQVGKSLAGTMLVSGGLVKRIGKTLAGILSALGALVTVKSGASVPQTIRFTAESLASARFTAESLVSARFTDESLE